MTINNRIENIIKHHWQQMVDNSYFYRGMSLNDLDLESKIILDPNKNPLKDMMPLLMEYSEFLLNLIEKGLEFEVNDFYVEPLQKVLNWTIRDIKNPGIDFTTNYADAATYAFNYGGSQVKHNFNIITSTISDCVNQPCFSEKERRQLLKLTKKVQELISIDKNIKHKPVVVKVKRSCAAFQNALVGELNIGSYQFFLERVSQKAMTSSAFNIAKITFFLHQQSQAGNFNMRLISPLSKADIKEIIKL
jgi:hypothetical protein